MCQFVRAVRWSDNGAGIYWRVLCVLCGWLARSFNRNSHTIFVAVIPFIIKCDSIAQRNRVSSVFAIVR